MTAIVLRMCYAMTAIVLRICYAMPYASATRCPVLKQAVLLPGTRRALGPGGGQTEPGTRTLRDARY
eukprot:3170046-Rhodomonas_salina.1